MRYVASDDDAISSISILANKIRDYFDDRKCRLGCPIVRIS